MKGRLQARTSISVSKSTMKGQVTLEYLFLAVVLLAVLAIAASALLGVRDSAEKSLQMLALKTDAQAIYNAAEDVCALGDGNSRTVTLHGKLRLESSGMGFSAGYGDNRSTARKLSCESGMNGWFEREMIVKNDGGTIVAAAPD
jgi:hypothetical protein